MIQALVQGIRFLPDEIIVAIVAALPVLEVRGAIPVGLLMGMDIKRVLLFSAAGNLIPAVVLLLSLESVSGYMSRFRFFNRFFCWLSERARRRTQLMAKCEFLGLMLFVAIPLPMTGAWTGCVAAGLFRMRFWHSFLAIFLGICVASLIVAALCLAGGGVFYNVFVPRIN
ncbi:MAG: small multi-drug export protein [Candidatus Omnitrophica bacterium]|jgi:uncharacterized membrane protein|nr:small multi-drug export protein [Candidatus Omnitrophota bacterium]